MIAKFNIFKESLKKEIKIGVNVSEILNPNTLQPLDGVMITHNNIYDFIKSYGYKLYLFSDGEENVELIKIVRKFNIRCDDILFTNKYWDYVDIMIDSSVIVASAKPLNKVSIKVNTPKNISIDGDINIKSYKDLTIDILRESFGMLKNNVFI